MILYKNIPECVDVHNHAKKEIIFITTLDIFIMQVYKKVGFYENFLDLTSF